MTSIPYLEAKVDEFITINRQWNINLLKVILNDHPIIHRIVGTPSQKVKLKTLLAGYYHLR